MFGVNSKHFAADRPVNFLEVDEETAKWSRVELD